MWLSRKCYSGRPNRALVAETKQNTFKAYFDIMGKLQLLLFEWIPIRRCSREGDILYTRTLHIGPHCSLVTNLVTNLSPNLVTNLVITKQGDKFFTKFFTKFGDKFITEFGAYRIHPKSWWWNWWQNCHHFWWRIWCSPNLVMNLSPNLVITKFVTKYGDNFVTHFCV